MPTFQSINFHPTLRHRLVVGGRPLESPHSLLLHNQQEWRLLPKGEAVTTTTVVAPHEVMALKRQVASLLHQATQTGKRQRLLHQVINSEESSNSNSKAVRIDGFLSLADIMAWQYNKTLQPPLQSGLVALDALVSNNNNNTTTNNDTNMLDNDDREMNNVTQNHHHESSSSLLPGLPWHSVVQLSGKPGMGKTQMALLWTVAAATQGYQVFYLLPASASCPALTKRLWQLVVANDHHDNPEAILRRITFYSFRDATELLLMVAQLEQQQTNNESRPWLLVVDGWSPSDKVKPQTWHRLVRLYHATVVVVSSATPTPSTTTTTSWGTLHLHLSHAGVLTCLKHVQQDKVGTSLLLFSWHTKQHDDDNNNNDESNNQVMGNL